MSTWRTADAFRARAYQQQTWNRQESYRHRTIVAQRQQAQHNATMTRLGHEMRRPIGIRSSTYPYNYGGQSNGYSRVSYAMPEDYEFVDVATMVFSVLGLAFPWTICVLSMINRASKYDEFARDLLEPYHLFLKVGVVFFSIFPTVEALKYFFGAFPETGNHSRSFIMEKITVYTIAIGILKLSTIPVVRWGLKESFSRATFMNDYGPAIKIAAFFFSISPLLKASEVSISFVAKLLSNYSKQSSRR
jgi:hypothetical protein